MEFIADIEFLKQEGKQMIKEFENYYENINYIIKEKLKTFVSELLKDDKTRFINMQYLIEYQEKIKKEEIEQLIDKILKEYNISDFEKLYNILYEIEWLYEYNYNSVKKMNRSYKYNKMMNSKHKNYYSMMIYIVFFQYDLEAVFEYLDEPIKIYLQKN